jgi:photosystem II stability/assembly factor-like uncharacterized protein
MTRSWLFCVCLAACGGAPTQTPDASTSPRDASHPPTPDANVPLTPASWRDVTNNLLALASGGGDVGVLVSVPGSARVIAGVARRGLFATDDGGATWLALGTGNGSAQITNGPTAVVFDPDNAQHFYESGIYGDGPYETDDGGVTFRRLGTISHNDGVSIDFTDPQRRTLLAGSHERTHQLWRSTDGGDSWTDIGASLPADSNFSTYPLVLSDQLFLLGSCGYAMGACGVLRSNNGGTSWSFATDEGPWGSPLVTSDATIYFMLNGNRGLMRSSDQGASWTVTASGPQQQFTGKPVELPDGRIVALGFTHLLITEDRGDHWAEIGEALPFNGANCGIYGFTYSPALKRFFANHNDCSGNLIAGSVWSAGFDWESQ